MVDGFGGSPRSCLAAMVYCSTVKLGGCHLGRWQMEVLIINSTWDRATHRNGLRCCFHFSRICYWPQWYAVARASGNGSIVHQGARLVTNRRRSWQTGFEYWKGVERKLIFSHTALACRPCESFVCQGACFIVMRRRLRQIGLEHQKTMNGSSS